MKIHTYASQGDLNGVRSELAKGAAIDARDEKDFTPLAYALISSDANGLPRCEAVWNHAPVSAELRDVED